MAVVTLTPPSITNTFPSPHADPIHKIHKIEERPLHLQNSSMFDIQDDQSTWRCTPLVSTYRQSRLDVSAYPTLVVVTMVRWISNIIDPHLPPSSVQCLGAFDILDVRCGFLNIVHFWPPFSCSPLQQHGPFTSRIPFSPLNDRIDQSKCFL